MKTLNPTLINYRELEQSGIAKVRPKKINIRLESLDTSENTYHMHGFSTGFDNDDIIDITINKRVGIHLAKLRSII